MLSRAVGGQDGTEMGNEMKWSELYCEPKPNGLLAVETRRGGRGGRGRRQEAEAISIDRDSWEGN